MYTNQITQGVPIGILAIAIVTLVPKNVYQRPAGQQVSRLQKQDLSALFDRGRRRLTLDLQLGCGQREVENIKFERKTIVSGKGGEAALKLYGDGTFICPVDTVLDNLKLVEDAINASQFKERCGIGISWQADLFYNSDKRNYELDNPKQLLDTDQLIDYYWKLCNDKPLIQYLEDPLFSGDAKGWQKLQVFQIETPQSKFKDTKVQIGTRKLYSSLEQLKQNFCPITQEQRQGIEFYEQI